MAGVLILGARGMLGRALAQALCGDEALTLWDIEELDITDAAAVSREITRLAPAEVINCAAFTDVDACETQQQIAFAVNGEGPGHVAVACRQTGARLTHLSSDYVFDGAARRDYREDDPPNPLSVYGRSKLAGEEAIRASGAGALIIRTQWLYGAGGRNFVDTIARFARERERLTVVNDQFGRPTWTFALAEGIAALLRTPALGTYHLAGSGAVCSWWEFAREIVDVLALATPVDAVDTSAYSRPATRPTRSALDCSAAERDWDVTLPEWRQQVRAYLGSPRTG